MRVKGAPGREGVDSRPYFHIHAPFIPLVPLAILSGGEGLTVLTQGALDHWTLMSDVKRSICHFRPSTRGVIKRPPDILPGPGQTPPDGLASW